MCTFMHYIYCTCVCRFMWMRFDVFPWVYIYVDECVCVDGLCVWVHMLILFDSLHVWCVSVYMLCLLFVVCTYELFIVRVWGVIIVWLCVVWWCVLCLCGVLDWWGKYYVVFGFVWFDVLLVVGTSIQCVWLCVWVVCCCVLMVDTCISVWAHTCIINLCVFSL